MEYFIGSPEDAEPTAEELGLKSPIAKQVYGLSRKVRELQGQLKEKDQRIAELNDHSMKKESEANKYREEYAQAMKMLRDANQRIAELEDASTLYYDANEALRKRIAELEATLDSIRQDPNWAVDLSYDEGVE